MICSQVIHVQHMECIIIQMSASKATTSPLHSHIPTTFPCGGCRARFHMCSICLSSLLLLIPHTLLFLHRSKQQRDKNYKS